jgi:hypothetical protein
MPEELSTAAATGGGGRGREEEILGKCNQPYFSQEKCYLILDDNWLQD